MSFCERAFLLGIFTFFFQQNIFCMIDDNFYWESKEHARIQECFEFMTKPIPTPMEIERGPDFNNYEREVCGAEVVYDKDNDVIMGEGWFQKKLLDWINLFIRVKKKENKDKLFNWLSENLWLIKKYNLSEWFLVRLKENRQVEICKMVSFYKNW